MKHPMRTLLYEFFIAPALQLGQRLFDWFDWTIWRAEYVPVPQRLLPVRARNDLRGAVAASRGPRW
jgi:hypothetical protein